VAGHSPRDRVRSSAIWRELGVELLLLRNERSQLMWFGHLVRMPFWLPSFGGFPGTSNREEAPGQTKTMLEGLYITSGLGTPGYFPYFAFGKMKISDFN